ncbi:MAG: hypothetical protein APF84_00995 [Gracilibacter sp. BRH_c7a]|nr:MAG: hypothetical protein APF84_00995 [Gracilibacter sp. BRH_c7a]
MLKLMKYEFIRKWRILLIFLSIVLVINANVLYRVLKWQNSSMEQMAALGVFFGGLVSVFFILFIINVTHMYSRDLNNKSGYMIFLTPNSGYKILGAKVLTGILEGFIFLGLFSLLMAGNYLGFFSQPLSDMINSEPFNKFFGQINMSVGEFLPYLISVLVTTFVSIVTLVLTIFAAETIRKSILAERRYGALISTIIFILLIWVNGKITSLVVNIVNQADIFTNGIHYLNLTTILQIIFGAAMFALSAYLLDKKMDI